MTGCIEIGQSPLGTPAQLTGARPCQPFQILPGRFKAHGAKRCPCEVEAVVGMFCDIGEESRPGLVAPAGPNAGVTNGKYDSAERVGRFFPDLATGIPEPSD